MKLPDRVLFVGAHCDDVELFAGGLLASCCRRGADVGVLVFSDHRGVADEATAARSRAEMVENLQWLQETTGTRPIDHTEDLLPACRGAFQERRALIYARLEALRSDYDLVVTHSRHDTNQDHRQVIVEAQRALKAHCSLLSGEFPSNDLGDFRAQLHVPLSEEDLSAKVELVQRYRSQQTDDRPYFSDAVLRGLAHVRGAQIRMPAAEAFEISGRLRVL